jgi:hypothetical protein
MRSLALCGALALVLLVSGCVPLPAETAESPAEAAETALPAEGGLVTASPPPVTAVATPAPSADLQVIFFTYQHPANVFSISLPETWTTRDDSTDERLLVTMEPPLGFASRLIVDVVYENNLTLDELAALRDGYLSRVYGGDVNYTEINRSELPDGRFQVTYIYNNPAGVSGRETVYLSQTGPYFSALRVFASDYDGVALAKVFDQIVASYTVNPTARWGEPEIVVNAEDLQVQGLNGWFDGQGNFRVAGRILNTWEANVGFVTVKASVCDPDGLVLDENTVLLVNDLLSPGQVAPFEIEFGLIDGSEPRPCLVEAKAEPASRLELDTYTDLVASTPVATYDAEAEVPILSVSGTVSNIGIERAHLIDVIITVCDADCQAPNSRVIGYAVTTTDNAELASGEATRFSYSFGPGELGGAPGSIELWVQGSILEPVPEG